MTISRDLSGCMRNVTRWVEITRVVCPMSVKATLEAVHGGASTTLSCKLFHVSTTLLLITFLRILNLDLRLNSLYL